MKLPLTPSEQRACRDAVEHAVSVIDRRPATDYTLVNIGNSYFRLFGDRQVRLFKRSLAAIARDAVRRVRSGK